MFNVVHSVRYYTNHDYSGDRDVTIWRPSVRLSDCLFRLFSNLNRAHTQRGLPGQHSTRPAYISAQVLQRRPYLLNANSQGDITHKSFSSYVHS